MKTIAITGASGFVGTNITRYFKNNYKIRWKTNSKS